MVNVDNYCGKWTAVQAVKWHPSVKQLAELVTWTDGRVKMQGDALILQTPDLIELVPEGHYIVRTAPDSFYVFTPDDFREQYAKVESEKAV